MSNQSSAAANGTYAAATAASQPTPPAEAVLTQLAFGALTTQALYVAAKLGIADLVALKPQPISELASATKTHERALYRVLRSLASVGVFAEVEPKVFGLTPLGEPLRSDAPNSVRNGAIFMGEEWHWRVWGNMLYSVRTGKPAWGHVHGAEVFDYFADYPHEAEIFNRAMTDMSVGTAPAIVEAYDFSSIGTLADIAGGHGFLLSQALKANPAMKGILFDVEPVIAGAGALLEREGVADRVEKVSGDFFASVPRGADAYMMKHIIHDWDDERCVTILSKINAAMNPQGRVLIIEVVVPEGCEPHYSKLLDLEMLVSPGGAERTAEEYRALLAAAGLRLNRILPTQSPFSIIEAVRESR
ncbi:MAG TPA: methyltransferase [Pyrinomonadaceae bacterium]|nr:methyltransferase [Pyrinomonadaceae bacterium]